MNRYLSYNSQSFGPSEFTTPRNNFLLGSPKTRDGRT